MHKSLLWLSAAIVLGLIGSALWLAYDGASSSTESAPVASLQPANYVGSDTCKGCHAEQYQSWQRSHHHKAMQEPTNETVLGDFDNRTVEFHGLSTRFFTEGDDFMLETIGDTQQVERFKVAYTFGYLPLQQYLIETQNGHLQAFNVAWDSRPEAQGGQRWFHLRNEPIDQQHLFYWTKHFQNWNSRCADCHSTNLQRNYSPAENSFATTFSEPNVACEACHGAASQHVQLAQSDRLKSVANGGFKISAERRLSWQFVDKRDIAIASGEKDSAQIDMCGRCHALRTPLVNDPKGSNFHDLNRLQLLNTGTYFADGQAREEAFVLGSFLQSKMAHKGVTCSNCHDPHSGATLSDNNGLCAQCHKPEVYDTSDHHRHAADESGAQCINCHMPERAFMQVDMRRDHSFTIPRPDLSLALGVPNACTQCHTDQDDAWAAAQVTQWGIAPNDDHWSYVLDRAANNDVLVTRAAVTKILDTSLPSMVRASLLAHLAPLPSRVSADIARQGLLDSSRLVRRAAVASLRGHSVDLRWSLLSAHLQDPSRSVRVEIAEVLLADYRVMSEMQKSLLNDLISEAREAYLVSADSPSSQLNLANMEHHIGNLEAAEQAYLQALKIEPSYLPALLSLAEFYRSTDRAEQQLTLLQRALQSAPDSAAAQHSLGLYLVRQQQYQQALVHLALAVEQGDATPYYAYVYAVAVENQGQLDKAIVALQDANARWPNQYELLLTLVLYLEKADRAQLALEYISNLSAIAPAAPAVKQLTQKYQSELQ